ncbi:hypothetical protein [Chitinophaga sp. XS-30]|uniref:hypothetical protein n=1 Tax=Chitinophaga sp. XS-30 TaxID=2604421 RepID=UPI0011DCA662|nr:hypothetical protein [Chitinophaga sp. XS-30]QEH39363.1 hypothetical protein FW415_00135 [Chitinophaga sp. XS-30]
MKNTYNNPQIPLQAFAAGIPVFEHNTASSGILQILIPTSPPDHHRYKSTFLPVASHVPSAIRPVFLRPIQPLQKDHNTH